MTIEAVLKKYESSLLKLRNVTGVGIGEKAGKPAIVVFVTEKLPATSLKPSDLIPKQLENYPVDVREEIKVG